MSLCPDVQKKAREELDAVVGPDRLPALVDRPKLPYINAIMKETLRWHTATPMAIAHTSTADDTYDGFFIPQGSTVMVNAWCVVPVVSGERLNDRHSEQVHPTRFGKVSSTRRLRSRPLHERWRAQSGGRGSREVRVWVRPQASALMRFSCHHLDRCVTIVQDLSRTILCRGCSVHLHRVRVAYSSHHAAPR